MYLELWKEDPFLLVLSYLLSSILVSTLLYLPTLERRILGLLESLRKHYRESPYSFSIDNEKLVSKFKIRQDTQPMEDESSFNSISSSHTSSSSTCVEKKKMEEAFVHEEATPTSELHIDEKEELNLKEAAGSDEDRNRSEVKDSELEFTENVPTDEIFQDPVACAEKEDDEMNIDAFNIDNESTSSNTENASYSKYDTHHESSDISDEEEAQYEKVLLLPISEKEIGVPSTEKTETSPSNHAEHHCEDSQDMVTSNPSSTKSSVEYLSSFDEYKLT